MRKETIKYLAILAIPVIVLILSIVLVIRNTRKNKAITDNLEKLNKTRQQVLNDLEKLKETGQQNVKTKQIDLNHEHRKSGSEKAKQADQ